MERVLPDLDDPTIYAQIDPGASWSRLLDMAGQCRGAWELVTAWTPPALPLPPRAVVIAGMGGSAIGGDLLRALAADQATVPIVVHRDYGLPSYAGPQTLVLASSYSGDTEETLSAAAEAQRRGAPLVALTTGGELAQRAEALGATLLTFGYEAQPRETLGYSVTLLLGVLVRMGLLPDPTPEVEATVATLEALRQDVELGTPTASNPAKELARWLYGHIPAVYGSGLLAPVARRWKCQFNENSKSWACFEELPEMDHNAVCGTVWPSGLAQNVRGLFLTSDSDHPRNRVRQQATRRLLEEAGVPCRTLTARGGSALARVLTATLLGDATSYYLAILYGMDPGSIPAIVALKEALGREES